MRKYEVALPDEVVVALEKIFSPEEVPLIVNQAVLREVEEFCQRHGIDYSRCAPGQDNPSPIPQDEDTNSQEWTS